MKWSRVEQGQHLSKANGVEKLPMLLPRLFFDALLEDRRRSRELNEDYAPSRRLNPPSRLLCERGESVAAIFDRPDRIIREDDVDAVAGGGPEDIKSDAVDHFTERSGAEVRHRAESVDGEMVVEQAEVDLALQLRWQLSACRQPEARSGTTTLHRHSRRAFLSPSVICRARTLIESAGHRRSGPRRQSVPWVIIRSISSISRSSPETDMSPVKDGSWTVGAE